MPYKLDGSDVPENIAKLPDAKRRQFAAVFNAAFSKCTDGGGDAKKCEGSAFAQANGVVLEDEPEGEGEEKSIFTVYKAGDIWRWASISNIAERDKDKEIITEQAYDDAIAHAQKSTEFGELDLVHTDGTEVGDADFMARVGHRLVEGGTWRDTPMAVKAREVVQAEPDYWGVSIKFVYDPSKFDGEIYKGGIKILKRSILPQDMAASFGTSISVMGGVKMRQEMRQETKDALEKLGVTPEEVKALAEKQATPEPENVKEKEATVWDKLKELVKGIVGQQADEGQPVPAGETTQPEQNQTEATQEAQPASPAVEPEVKQATLNDEQLKALDNRFIEGIKAVFAPVQAQMVASDARLTQLEARLKAAEQAVEDKVIARLSELPPVVKVSATEVNATVTNEAIKTPKTENPFLADVRAIVSGARGEVYLFADKDNAPAPRT